MNEIIEKVKTELSNSYGWDVNKITKDQEEYLKDVVTATITVINKI